MKSIRENAGVLILCIAELLVGILLLINPVGFTAGIVIAAGVLLIASGLQSVVRYVTTDPATGVREQGLARGLTAIALGVFCAMQTRQVISAFPVLTVLYGVVLLVTGLYKTQAVVDAQGSAGHRTLQPIVTIPSTGGRSDSSLLRWPSASMSM